MLFAKTKTLTFLFIDDLRARVDDSQGPKRFWQYTWQIYLAKLDFKEMNSSSSHDMTFKITF